MPIYPDKRSGRLFVQFDYNKQTFKQYLPPGATRSLAAKLEVKMRSDAFFQANGMAPRNETLFEDAVQDYLAHIQANPQKYERAERVLITAKPFLKGKQIRSITPIDIERFIHCRTASPIVPKYKDPKKRKPATIWREVAVISAFFTFCIKKTLCEANPCKSVEKPEFSNIQDKQLDYTDEPDFLAAFYEETARDICIFVLHTGLSQGDVFDLTDFQINRHRREIALIRGKTKEQEFLPLNDTAWAIIEPRLGNGGLLFRSSKTGGRLTSIRKAMYGACRRVNLARKEAGMPGMPTLTIRDLRRTFGSRLEGDDQTKRRLLTHADTRMLPRYVRNTERMREAVENLDKSTPALPYENLRIAK